MTAKIDGTAGLLQQYDYQVSTTGFSYTFAAGTNVLVMNPAGTLATGTITMPASPADGMTISFSSTQIISSLTVNANTGQSIVGKPTSLVAGGAATFVYRLSNTTWYTQVNTNNAAGFSNMAVITTTNASYSIPATKIKVTVVGGGGGSAGINGAPAASAGGGGGGAAVQILSGLTIGSTLNVTIGAGGTAGTAGTGNGGAGGTTSVASGTQTISTVSATGGAGSTNYASVGAAGGLGSGGLLNIKGGAGANPDGAAGNGGSGGSSILGGGGNPIANPSNGNTGGAYGGGASGSSSSGQNQSGGVGAAGVVIVEY